MQGIDSEVIDFNFNGKRLLHDLFRSCSAFEKQISEITETPGLTRFFRTVFQMTITLNDRFLILWVRLETIIGWAMQFIRDVSYETGTDYAEVSFMKGKSR